MAEFAARLDAINFGPGATRYAHRRDERVEIAALGAAFETLRAVRSPRITSPCRSRPCSSPGDVPVRAARGGEARGAEAGLEIIDFGIGDPREPTARDPAGARRRARGRSGYPLAQGLPELREAIAGWCERRFGVGARPGPRDHPDATGARRRSSASRRRSTRRDEGRSSSPSPATRCPSAARSSPARRSSRCRCSRRTASSPTSTRSTDWDGARALLGQLPEQPDGRGRAARLLRAARRAGARARLRPLPPTRPTASSGSTSPRLGAPARRPAQRAVFNTLSKRSSMTGYRSGFVAGDAGARRRAASTFRPSVGAAPQEFVQRASVAAWNDEAARRAHARRATARKRERAARRARARRAGASRRARRRCTSG